MKKFISLAAVFALMVSLTLADVFADPPMRYPTGRKVPISSKFGMTRFSRFKAFKHHKGIDFSVPIGTPIMATADGIVTKAINSKTGFGNHILIEHDGAYETLYAHLSELFVIETQTVKKGDFIGYSGNSGRSTGPHLHYEVRENGKAVDPANFL